MQLSCVLGSCIALAMLSMPAVGQSLSPMHRAGYTPTDVKAFRLEIGNPYPTPMTFVIVPMSTDFIEPADQAVVSPAEARIQPGGTRSVVVQFRILPASTQRTVGVCVYPKEIEGPVLPRVCGTYTGQLLSRRSG